MWDCKIGQDRVKMSWKIAVTDRKGEGMFQGEKRCKRGKYRTIKRKSKNDGMSARKLHDTVISSRFLSSCALSSLFDYSTTLLYYAHAFV